MNNNDNNYPNHNHQDDNNNDPNHNHNHQDDNNNDNQKQPKGNRATAIQRQGLLRVLKLHYQVTSSHLPAPQILRVLKLYYKVASARLHFARSTRAISAEGCAGTGQIALSPAFRALDMRNLRRGWCRHRTNRTLACISRTRHARSPQRVARAWDKSHSRLHFAHSTRTISAEGCARMGQIALSPAFRALDTHDLRRGLRAHGTNRTLACISHTRHARSPQRVARAPDKSHSRLHFAHSTCAISAEGGAGTGQIALSPAYRALDTHDLRRGLRAHGTNRTLACISRTRHARSPQRVARAWDKSHSRLHFAHSTRTISAEGCTSSLQNERFVRDFLKNSHAKVCKTSVSYETSSKSQAETPTQVPETWASKHVSTRSLQSLKAAYPGFFTGSYVLGFDNILTGLHMQ